MLAQRRRDINKLAAMVRQAVKLADLPVDVERAIMLLNGTVTNTTADDVEAMITKSSGSFEIHISDSVPLTRKRFSLAHELGHLFLHMGYLINPVKWNGINEYLDSPKYRYGFSEEEYEAHEFAGAFLMPDDVYRDMVSSLSINGRVNLSPIADRFGVSEEAAKVRGQWLGILSWER